MTPKNIRLVAHALLGGSIGLLTSIIFCLIYIFQDFSQPVPDFVRLKSAVISTAIILGVIIAIIKRKEIVSLLAEFASDGKS